MFICKNQYNCYQKKVLNASFLSMEVKVQEIYTWLPRNPEGRPGKETEGVIPGRRVGHSGNMGNAFTPLNATYVPSA